jgi:hypothetical protein
MMIKCEFQWSHESQGLQNVKDEQMDLISNSYNFIN